MHCRVYLAVSVLQQPRVPALHFDLHPGGKKMKALHKVAVLAAAALLLILAPLPTCMGQDLPPQLPEVTQFDQICDPTQYGPNPDDPAIPALPKQLSLHVEANILNENRVTWIHEFFDEVNNRGRINFINDGVREEVIFDYINNEIFLIPDVTNNRECSVHPLTESRFLNFTFGLTRVNGSIHIGSARNFLEFLDDDTPINFMGANNTVRGVPTSRWDACINNDNVSFIASYYYNFANWTYPTVSDPSGSDSILSQMVVRGVSFFNDTLRNFYHVYSVFGFHSGPMSVPNRVFRVPTGLVCVGRIPGLPTPTVPDYFSLYAERFDRTQNEVSIVREFYDYQHQLFRVDAYYDGRFGGDSGPFQLIQDVGSGVGYYINQHTGNCTASPLTQTSSFIGDLSFDDDGTPHLVSPIRLFLLDSNFSYEGVSTVRGVEVDSWITQRDSYTLGSVVLTDLVYEFFFTRPGYTLTTDRSTGLDPVPWAYNIRGIATFPNYSEPTNTSMRAFNVSASLYDFSADEPPFDAFDASLCFSADDTHTVGLLFPTSAVGIDFRTFRTNLRASLVNFLDLRPLQINNIHIVRDNGTHIFVALHFTNISEFAMPTANDVTADGAADALEGASDFGDPLPFQVELGNGASLAPIYLFRNRGRDTGMNNTCNNTCPTSPPTKDPNGCDNITGRLKLSDGIIAAIGIGLFVVGFFAALIAGLVCFLCCKFMKGRGSLDVTNVKYKKHDDELESM